MVELLSFNIIKNVDLCAFFESFLNVVLRRPAFIS